MTLNDYTRLAAEERGERFRDGSAEVTVVAYFFRDETNYDEKFAHLAGALLETWRKCGRMRTVVVANRVGGALAHFAARYPWVEVQVEPSLVPGDINTMSRDCNARLFERFRTKYALVVQDDGFPLRPGLEEFVARGYDFIGSPYCRPTFVPDLLTRLLNYCPSNGGFSLRSRRMCELAARLWREHYDGRPFVVEEMSEDLFYTVTLPKTSLRLWASRRQAPSGIAERFSYEGVFPLRSRTLPFGFHTAKGFAYLDRRFGITGGRGTPQWTS